jgi:hypothetical protein
LRIDAVVDIIYWSVYCKPVMRGGVLAESRKGGRRTEDVERGVLDG